jgi:hypothetical protein
MDADKTGEIAGVRMLSRLAGRVPVTVIRHLFVYKRGDFSKKNNSIGVFVAHIFPNHNLLWLRPPKQREA